MSIVAEWAAKRFGRRANSLQLLEDSTLMSASAARLCLDCEEPIPAKRIAAMPDATRCARCQSVVDEPLVASPTLCANPDEMNAADFAIVRRIHRQRDEAILRAMAGDLPS